MRVSLTTVAAAAMAVWSASAMAQQAEVLWLGQAATRITTTTGKVIVIDPFLKKNPKTPTEWKDLSKLGKVDLILITHAHFDHTADALELARLNDARIVGNAELIRAWTGRGMLDKRLGIAMNKGGTVTPLGAGIRITQVSADHSSGLAVPGDDGKMHTIYAGAPVGYVIELENGFKIYHSGDTNVFGDMALINKLFEPDLALVPIGGHFTMDPAGAAHAVRELIKPRMVIPIHYGTFPPLKGTPSQFKAALGETKIKVLDIAPGQSVRF